MSVIDEKKYYKSDFYDCKETQTNICIAKKSLYGIQIYYNFKSLFLLGHCLVFPFFISKQTVPYHFLVRFPNLLKCYDMSQSLAESPQR